MTSEVVTFCRGDEKYSPGVMLFGGITSEGLVPRNEPIFFTEWLSKHCKKIKKEKKTLDNRIYADFIKKTFAQRLRRDLNDDLSEYIWQDDGDKKHRTRHVLETLKGVFSQRIDVQHQADKMADVWVIENVWGIIAEKLRGKTFSDMASLKRSIRKSWREIDQEMCTKMMTSIPSRLKAVIRRKGEQIHKNDYS